MSEGKGIQSLLKYRYQRKDSDKIPTARAGTKSAHTPSKSTTPEPTQNGIQGPGSWYSLPTTPPKPMPEPAVPDTPESQRPSPGSPVFNNNCFKKPGCFKRGIMVLASDSEDDPTSPIKSPTSSGSAQWLSKQSIGKAQNGCINSSASYSASSSPSISQSLSAASSSASSSSSSQSSQSQRSLTNREREKISQITNLEALFPGQPRDILEEALDCTPDFEKAVDFMIGFNNMPKKRRRILSSQSSEDDSPQHKRSRQLSYEDSQEGPGSGQRDAAANGSLDTSLEGKIDFLAEAFPTVSRQMLEMTLQAQNNSVELASVALSTFSPGSAVSPSKPLSQTQNVGSIKAYQAARAEARKAATDTVELSSDEDTDDLPARKTTGKGKVAETLDLEDEDEEYFDDEDVEREELEEGNLDPILEYFNEATLEELVSLSGCSKKKAIVLLDLRPFENWEDLVTKFESQPKMLSFSLVTECKEILRIRRVVQRLMERCEKMSVKMAAIASELTRETSMEDIRSSARAVQQPRNLNPKMRLTPYQMVGLNWLMLMHSQDLNGILGDEMGLGKTIQTIAFLAQMLQDGDLGPHIVISPSSTIDNWLRELKIWCPDLKVILYYGGQDERRDMRMRIASGDIETFHVIVTSYNIASGSVDDRAFFKKIQFHYAVFDEGHMLKNMESRRYQSLMKMKADRRLLLTGTPLQNNLLELMSLLSFVMPELFTGKASYLKRIFTNISKQKNNEPRGTYEQNTIAQAKRILKPFFLRRLKTEVLKQLPKKTETVERVPLAFEQQDLYDDLRTTFARKVQESKDSGEVFKGQAGAAMLMQLRKAANHHLLHRRQFDDTRLRQMAQCLVQSPSHQDANEEYVFEDMQVMSDFELHQLCKQYSSLSQFKLDNELITDSGKFRYLDQLLSDFKTNGDRVLLFSQFTMMLDIMEVYMKARGHRFIRLDGQTVVAERQDLIDKYNTDPGIFVFLLSTRAGGLGINLTSANKVILHDIDFNPYNDKQAEDRCHRVGQTRDVTVYRLVAKNTVEEAILKCAQDKLKLEKDVTGTGKDDSDDASPHDMASLLQEALATQNSD